MEMSVHIKKAAPQGIELIRSGISSKRLFKVIQFLALRGNYNVINDKRSSASKFDSTTRQSLSNQQIVAIFFSQALLEHHKESDSNFMHNDNISIILD